MEESREARTVTILNVQALLYCPMCGEKLYTSAHPVIGLDKPTFNDLFEGEVMCNNLFCFNIQCSQAWEMEVKMQRTNTEETSQLKKIFEKKKIA